MIDFDFVPETLDNCEKHYVPPIMKYVHCADFGNCDGTVGSCWWCKEMTPYQWHMCSDECWLRNLMSSFPAGKFVFTSKEEAAEFIENTKQLQFKLFHNKGV